MQTGFKLSLLVLLVCQITWANFPIPDVRQESPPNDPTLSTVSPPPTAQIIPRTLDHDSVSKNVLDNSYSHPKLTRRDTSLADDSIQSIRSLLHELSAVNKQLRFSPDSATIRVNNEDIEWVGREIIKKHTENMRALRVDEQLEPPHDEKDMVALTTSQDGYADSNLGLRERLEESSLGKRQQDLMEQIRGHLANVPDGSPKRRAIDAEVKEAIGDGGLPPATEHETEYRNFLKALREPRFRG
jgi:hypothetical protein